MIRRLGGTPISNSNSAEGKVRLVDKPKPVSVDFERFTFLQGKRFECEVCANGIPRVCYKPFSEHERSCLDCIHFDVERMDPKKNTPLLPWCTRRGRYQSSILIEDKLHVAPRKCGSFQLVSITKAYCAHIPPIPHDDPSKGSRVMGRPQSQSEFCRRWPFVE